MKTTQILLLGGGTVFGALTAVALMNFKTSDDTDTASGLDGSNPKLESAKTKGQPDDEVASRIQRIKIVPAPDQVAEIDPKELEERRDEFRNDMRERQMERLTNKMAKWSAALGLDKDQQGKLLDLADQQFDEMAAMEQTVEGGDPTTISDSAKRAMAIMSGRALEESMVEMFSPEQKEKYQEFGSAQRQNRVEASSLRQLASLQEDLMLTPEQRNGAYGIIYANQMEQAEGNSDVSSMTEPFASQSGITVDPALQGLIFSIANKGLEQLATGERPDGEEMRSLAESTLSSSVVEQVELLRPVLTEGPLERYRGQLEDRFPNLANLIPGRRNAE